MPIDSHLPQADPFSLVPTFNRAGSLRDDWSLPGWSKLVLSDSGFRLCSILFGPGRKVGFPAEKVTFQFLAFVLSTWIQPPSHSYVTWTKKSAFQLKRYLFSIHTSYQDSAYASSCVTWAEKLPFQLKSRCDPGRKVTFQLKSRLFSWKGNFLASILFIKIRPLITLVRSYVRFPSPRHLVIHSFLRRFCITRLGRIVEIVAFRKTLNKV